MSTTVRDLLMRKKPGVTTVSEHDSVYGAVHRLIENNIGAVLVMQGEACIGVMSERDVARQVVLAGKGARETTVGEIMSRTIVFVRPEQSVEECMEIVTEKRIRHLPVIEDDRVIGIVSIGDLVNSMISEKQFVIEQLESYITGRIS